MSSRSNMLVLLAVHDTVRPTRGTRCELRHPANAPNRDWWSKALSLGARLLDRAHHVHPSGHTSKCCEALAVRVAVSAEVEGWLIADADEKVGRRGVRARAGHRQRSVLVPESSGVRPLEVDGRKTSSLALWVRSALNHLDTDGVVGLVGCGDRTMKHAAGIKPA